MNYLSHVYLSGNNNKIIVGGMIADAIKGKQFELYEKEISVGIKLHRAIDQFTDIHPLVKKSKERLYVKYHKYAGVIVDMFYDHFLAKNWNDYSAAGLQETARHTYGLLLSYYDILPPKIVRIIPFMIYHNWFVAYADIGKLSKHFEGIARRTVFKSNLEKVTDELHKNYHLYEVEFRQFFPELIAFADDYLKKTFILEK